MRRGSEPRPNAGSRTPASVAVRSERLAHFRLVAQLRREGHKCRARTQHPSLAARCGAVARVDRRPLPPVRSARPAGAKRRVRYERRRSQRQRTGPPELRLIAERIEAGSTAARSCPMSATRTRHRPPAVGRCCGCRMSLPTTSFGRCPMSVFDSIPTTPVEVSAGDPLLDDAQLAAVAFLARYGGRTLESYRADLRQFFQWDSKNRSGAVGGDTCARRAVPGVDGGSRAGGIDGRSAAVDGVRLLPLRPPRRPHPRQPGAPRSPTAGSIRAPSGAWTTASWPPSCTPPSESQPPHAALAVLLGLNGLRVSEACGADVEDLGFERGHRTLRIIGKGNRPAVVPLVPRSARSVDLAIGERTSGPILVRHDGARLDTRTSYRWVRATGRHAGLDHVHPRMLPRRVHHGRPRRRRAAPRRATGRPDTPTHAPPPSTTGAARTSTDTPPTPWSRSSPAADKQPGSDHRAPNPTSATRSGSTSRAHQRELRSSQNRHTHRASSERSLCRIGHVRST